MKKIITIILSGVVLFAMTTAASASEKGPSRDGVVTIERKADINEFKTKLVELKNEREGNYEQNQGLRQQNKLVQQQIKERLVQLKISEKKLSLEAKKSVKSLKEEIKILRAEIKETKGDVKEILLKNKENLKNKDVATVKNAYSQAFEIQKARYLKLQQINENLSQILQTIR